MITNAAEQALQILQAQYGLNGPTLKPLTGGTGATLKALYLVQSNNETYVLKGYRPDFRTQEDVTALHAAQHYLRQHGFPVAAAIPGRNGQTVTSGENASWVLYPYVEGRHLQPGRIGTHSAAVLGETLGHMDQLLRAWETDWPGAEPFQAYPPAERIALCEELLRHAEQGKTPADLTCIQVLRQAIGGLERMAPVAPRIIAMERQWVHGDPNEGNFLYARSADRVEAVIDFDNMRRAPRGFDFIYALTSFFPAAGPARDAYARAYMQVVHPSAAELELYAPLWAYWQVCDIWPIDVRYLRPAEYDERWHIQPIDGRWEHQIDAITSWLLQIASRG